MTDLFLTGKNKATGADDEVSRWLLKKIKRKANMRKKIGHAKCMAVPIPQP